MLILAAFWLDGWGVTTHRPGSGTTARQSTGTTPRPNTGTTAQP